MATDEPRAQARRPRAGAPGVDPLAAYRGKRDFGASPEPDGPVAASPPGTLRFVVQKHHARQLHYDFRLEIDGTLKSWAVPKGPSLDPATRRMAVQVEDHPLAYAGFEGDIPEGQYGAGHVIVWDEGHWVPDPSLGDPARAWAEGKLEFELQGHKLRGRWHLVRTRGGNARQPAWLLFKGRDVHARAGSEPPIVETEPGSVLGRGPATDGPAPSAATAGVATAPPAPLPETLAPALATLVDARPPGPGWAWEVKFDGYRILARLQDGRARLLTRGGHDWTAKLAPLARDLETLGLADGWLDGEIVVPGPHGVPDFQALQRIFEPRGARRSAPASSELEGLRYYAFDLPFYGGRDLRDEPLHERRALLQSLLAAAPTDGRVAFSEDFEDDGDLLGRACQLNLEGLIGKRRDSPYPRGRSRDWIKLKCQQRQEFVIGGWTDPQGSRAGLGALLVGVHDGDGALQYAGKVGTGFDAAGLESLAATLAGHARDTSPFAGKAPVRRAHWVEPVLVAEVSFTEWTGDGHLRHPVFKGLRADKPASAIVRERAVAAPPPAPAPAPAHAPAAAPARAASKATPRASARVASSRAKVSSPDRVIDAESGVTKAELHAYYEAAAPLLLPGLRDRPVALLRAPSGVGGPTFFQKHAAEGQLPLLTRLDPALDPDHEPLLAIASTEALLQAVQMNVVEFHTWNARVDRIEQPDRLVFDLDPGEGVAWAQVVEGTLLVKGLLDELGLASFCKTSGGKGLHVVVPLLRRDGWDTVKGFAQAVVQHLAAHAGGRFVAKSGPKNRVGRIFVDYLRNGRGATTAAAYSVRVRPGLGVSLPVRWDELVGIGQPHATVRNADSLLPASATAWEGCGRVRQTLGPAMKRLGWAP